MRYDLERSQIAHAIEGCKNVFEDTLKQREKDGILIPQGIFSKLKLPSKVDSIFGWKKR